MRATYVAMDSMGALSLIFPHPGPCSIFHAVRVTVYSPEEEGRLLSPSLFGSVTAVLLVFIYKYSVEEYWFGCIAGTGSYKHNRQKASEYTGQFSRLKTAATRVNITQNFGGDTLAVNHKSTQALYGNLPLWYRRPGLQNSTGPAVPGIPGIPRIRPAGHTEWLQRIGCPSRAASVGW